MTCLLITSSISKSSGLISRMRMCVHAFLEITKWVCLHVYECLRLYGDAKSSLVRKQDEWRNGKRNVLLEKKEGKMHRTLLSGNKMKGRNPIWRCELPGPSGKWFWWLMANLLLWLPRVYWRTCFMLGHKTWRWKCSQMMMTKKLRISWHMWLTYALDN